MAEDDGFGLAPLGLLVDLGAGERRERGSLFLPRQREGWREIVESVAFLDIFTAGFDFRTFL